MTFADVIECAARELGRRKWRTALAVAGYALAVAVFAVLVCALRFSRQQADAVLSSTGTHFVAYSPLGAPACPECRWMKPEAEGEGWLLYGQPTNMIARSAVEKIRTLPAVKDASPYLMFRFRNPVDGTGLVLGGFDPQSKTAVGTTCCAATDIVGGHFLAPDEEGAVMLEEAYASAKGLRSGGTIRIGATEYGVAGVVNPGIRPGKADVYMHIEEARALIARKTGSPTAAGEANVILVEVRSSQLQEEAMRSLKVLLPGLMVSSYACWRPAALVMGMNEAAVWILSLTVLLFAGLLALKSQLAAVIERRRDVAILKAIGWDDGSVVRTILAESVLQALAGGIAGSAAAALILLLLPARLLTGVATAGSIPPGAGLLLGGILMAVLCGAVAGAVPAILAARQSPADALRRL